MSIFIPRNYITIIDKHGGQTSTPHFTINDNKVTLETAKGGEYDLLDLLKQACSCSRTGVLEAYSNFVMHVPISFESGTIAVIDLTTFNKTTNFKYEVFSLAELPVGTIGQINNLGNPAGSFLHFQGQDENTVSVASSHFVGRKLDGKIELYLTLCFRLKENNDEWIQCLYISLKNYAESNYNFAAIILNCSLDILTRHMLAKRGMDIDSKINMRLKKLGLKNLSSQYEKHIAKLRNNAGSHAYTQVHPDKLKKAFSVALEIIWYIEKL